MAQVPRKARFLTSSSVNCLAVGYTPIRHHDAPAGTVIRVGRRLLHSGVHRRQSILPTTTKTAWRPHQRVDTRSAYAVSSPPQETPASAEISCDRSRPIKDRRPHRSAAADMSLRHNEVPVSPFVVLTHPGTTRECSNDRPLPCRSVAQIQRRLPSSLSSASTQATLPLYGLLKHVTDQVTHRGPARPPQRFLR